MSLYNQLTAEERDMIADYIDRYAPEEGVNCGPASLEYRLRFWNQNKSKYLYKMFGGNFILEREIEYETSFDELVARYQKVENVACRHFYNDLYNKLWNSPEWKELMFDSWATPVRGYSCIYSYLADRGTLIKNRWEGKEMILPLPNDKSFKVAPGTKITRIFGRLAKAYNLENWEDVRQAQADALTVKKIKGTLCLSIHPMDYMTMSDNCENWDSCMNWMDGGGYRAGTVEMMNSNMVVVAYLKNPYERLEGYWNSKIWRELFIVTPDLITNIKAYPFQNPWLTKLILNWLKELAETSGISAYENKLHLISGESETLDDPWFHKNNISVYFTTNVMYNDCGRVDQWFYFRENDWRNSKRNNDFHINYSGERICMYCGETESSVNFEDEHSLLCEDCEYKETVMCDICGDYLDPEDAYEVDGLYYCSECYNETFVTAFDSLNHSERQRAEDCEQIALLLPDGTFSSYTAYIYDCNNFIKEVYPEGEETWESLMENSDGFKCIPYAKASLDIKMACGIYFYELNKYDAMINEQKVDRMDDLIF